MRGLIKRHGFLLACILSILVVAGAVGVKTYFDTTQDLQSSKMVQYLKIHSLLLQGNETAAASILGNDVASALRNQAIQRELKNLDNDYLYDLWCNCQLQEDNDLCLKWFLCVLTRETTELIEESRTLR